MRRPRVNTRTGASLLVYTVLLAFALFEQLGRTTSDTKTPLIEDPAKFLLGATTLWDPSTDFGQLQNQAYGYLFPQGPFFLALHLVHVAPWVTERLWSVGVIMLAAEGARLLGRATGLVPWAAWVAGMSYGLSPRILSQVGVRSAEVLPTAALPWAALPLVLALSGRLSPRRAALLSAGAFMFSGAVNATATVAGLPLLAVLIVWGARRRAVPWSMLGWWSLFIALTNFWWAASLIRLRAYSPPFFDFVEDSRATTETTGYAATLRGLSNWINYAYLGNTPNWPAGYAYSYEPWLVLASGLVAALGVGGLVVYARPWRTPLAISALIGVVLVTIAHGSPFQSPLTGAVRTLLDGDFALLRNVSKAELLLRLPLCLGVGAVFARVLERRLVRRTRRRSLAAAAVVALVLGLAQPAVAMELRTPGWRSVPSYWSQTADYLAQAPGEQRAWLIPGTGFALQTWGWTLDEPFQSVARSPWVSRSQIPLAPPQTIRILTQLEHYLESGSGSPNLGSALGRLGLGYVVVRHDLDEGASDTTTSNLVAIALARSRGVERVKTFGTLDFGPAIEVYRVTSGSVAKPVEVHPLSSVATVQGASSDVINAVVEGALKPSQPAIVQGDEGWKAPATVVGDSYRDRERNFGRVHDAEGPVLTPTEPRHGGRVVPDYPANAGSEPVEAAYDGNALVEASSSQAWTNGLGRVAAESAPYSAFDGDPATGWRSAYYQPAGTQWLDVRWPTARQMGRFQIRSPAGDARFADVTRWRITAGKLSRTATVNPFTGLASADLGEVSSRHLRISVDKVRGDGRRQVSILEVRSPVTPIQRTLVLPKAELGPEPTYVFSAQPETRACITTLLGPDCSADRQARSEESGGIDRTFATPGSGSWTLSGTVVARADPSTSNLLIPVGSADVVHSSSQWPDDPAVGVRMACDTDRQAWQPLAVGYNAFWLDPGRTLGVVNGEHRTSWIADPKDASPTLTVDFAKPRVIDRIAVGPPASPAVSPTRAVIRSREGTRRVGLGIFGQFPPLRTRHLTITFSNATRGVAPIGLSELYLPPRPIAVPLDGGALTGAICGFGPILFVDGRRYDTAVTGFMGDVFSAGPLSFGSCSGPVVLGPGEHTFRLGSTAQFQPVNTLLRASDHAAPSGGSRLVGGATGPQTDQRVRVRSGPASILATTRNVNPGWRATLDGKPLAPMISDGWAQAWRLPAGRGGTVVITYAPQGPYLVALYGGLGIAALVLVLAILALWRSRLRPARPVPEPAERPLDRRRRWRTVALVLPLSWVFGGLPGLVGVALVAVVRRRGVVRVMAVSCLVVAPGILAWQLLDGPVLRFNVVDVLAGAGFWAALVSMMPAVVGRRGAREP